MNGQFDDELLSAYHDGELQDAERQSVADRIAEDSELREILEDYSELSNSVKSLPRTPAPDGFHAAVMQQVQGSTVVRAQQQQSQRSRRQSWLWIAATAASLVIAVGLFQFFNRGPADVGMQVAGDAQVARNADASPAATLAMAPSESAEEGGFGGGGFDEQQMLMAESGAVADAELPMHAELFSNDPQLVELLRSLAEEPTAGEQLEVLQRVGDELVLIEFQVVDVVEAFGEVQYLLDELGMTRLDGSEEAVAASEPENRLRGILVAGSHEDLLAAFDEIDDLESVVLVDTNGADMAEELGVDPAQLPMRMQADRSIAVDAANENVQRAQASADPASRQPPASQSRAETRPSDRDQPAAGADDAVAQRERTDAGYQVSLSLSDDVVRAIEGRQQEQHIQRGDARPADEDAIRADRDARDGGRPQAVGERIRSRILIVFIEGASGEN